MIRRCTARDRDRIFEIIDSASVAYRGAIPEDCWHKPYMPLEELEREIAADVDFWGYEEDGQLLGVMGIQKVKDVQLIRHAYVLPGTQGKGIGTQLLAHLEGIAEKPLLIGTWRDATWAIRFYERHGFELVPESERVELLRRYWTLISDRQVEVSIVLRQRS